MKRCSACGETHLSDAFNRCASSVDGLQAYGRSCQREYHARHRDRINPLIHRRTRERREVVAARVFALLCGSVCTDCGEDDPVVLEFDHVNGEKTADVSKLMNDGLSWQRIADEIAKCEVVCANRHRRRTARRMESLRWRWMQRVGRPGLEPGTTTA